jgi:hypothetical protein
MSNNTAVTQTTNIVPVQGVFAPEPSFALQYFVGPAGTPFYGPENAVFTNIATITGTIATTTLLATQTLPTKDMWIRLPKVLMSRLHAYIPQLLTLPCRVWRFRRAVIGHQA